MRQPVYSTVFVFASPTSTPFCVYMFSPWVSFQTQTQNMHIGLMGDSNLLLSVSLSSSLHLYAGLYFTGLAAHDNSGRT